MLLLASLLSCWLCPSRPDFAPVSVVDELTSELGHRVVFAVRQRNLEVLEEALVNVSTPTHPDYLKHWSREAVANLTANPEATSRVLKYLQAIPDVRNVTSTFYGEYITAVAPVRAWADILNATFSVYHNNDTLATVIRADNYTLPVELVDHVGLVFNVRYTHSFLHQHQRPRRSARASPATTATRRASTSASAREKSLDPSRDLNLNLEPLPLNVTALLQSSQRLSKGAKAMSTPNIEIFGYVTPSLINRIYGVSSNTAASSSNLPTQVVYAAIGQFYSLADLATFNARFQLPSPTIVDIGGHVDDSTCVRSPNDCAGKLVIRSRPSIAIVSMCLLFHFILLLPTPTFPSPSQSITLICST